MKLTINGEAREATAPCDLPALLRELGLPSQGILVEHNGLALRQTEWEGRTLADGDRLEIIRIVAGG